jgi:hypothetical protein
LIPSLTTPPPPNQLPDDWKAHADKLSSFTFTVSDAVWLVQQCRRWQINNSGGDPSTYWVSETRAEIAYGVGGGKLPYKWCRGIRSRTLIKIAAELFTTRGHADEFVQELREGEMKRKMRWWEEHGWDVRH